MALSNREKCRRYRRKQPKKLALPLPEGTRQALERLMKRHDFSEAQELLATAIHRLDEMPECDAAKVLAVSQHQFTPSPELCDRLYMEGARSREEA